MASHVSFVIGGLLLVFLTCRSAPIEKVDPNLPPLAATNDQKPAINQEILQPTETDKSSTDSTSTTTSRSPLVTTTTIGAAERNDAKRKREINDDQLDLSDEIIDPYSTSEDDEDDDGDDSGHVLYTNVKESPETLHGNVDRLADTDESNLFSDLQMDPTELATILHRRRRDVKSVDRTNQRGKRSLAPYGLASSDSFYDPWSDLLEEQSYVRPLRSFAPIYWYPPKFERNVRSYERTAWPVEYVNPLITNADVNDEDDDGDDDDDDDESPIAIYDAEGDENDYELNRYPVLLKSHAYPYDNLQLQQMYNTDDFPLDDNDEDSLAVIDDFDGNDDEDDDDDDNEYPIFYRRERPSYIPYGSIDNYIEV